MRSGPRYRDRQPFLEACNDAIYAIHPPSLHLAFGLRTIDAKRIELRHLVQESFLRRHRDHHASIDQQDRLTKLQVPVSQRQPPALERRNGKVGPLKKLRYRLWVTGFR